MHLLHKCALGQTLNGIFGEGLRARGVSALSAVWMALPVSTALIKELNNLLESEID